MSKRVAIVIDDALFNRMNECFAWGERNRVMVRLIEWMCEKVEKYGSSALMLLLRDGNLNELIKMDYHLPESAPLATPKEEAEEGEDVYD